MGRPTRKRRKRRHEGPTAATADRHELYQHAVQDAQGDLEFFLQAWTDVHGEGSAPARHLREDFCGTALLAAHWVAQGEGFTAEGYDLDPEVLAWGQERNIQPLGEAARRLSIIQGDVREPAQQPADIRCAHNFSYNTFHERAVLLDYLRHCREGLAEGGMLILDMYGGHEAIQEQKEEREVEEANFTYVWEQARFRPGNGRTLCRIHFRFGDGSWMRNAFEYDWRLWTMPELKDLFVEAGFSRSLSYFEQFDEDGDGTGEYAADDGGWPAETWLAYLVAVR